MTHVLIKIILYCIYQQNIPLEAMRTPYFNICLDMFYFVTKFVRKMPSTWTLQRKDPRCSSDPWGTGDPRFREDPQCTEDPRCKEDPQCETSTFKSNTKFSVQCLNEARRFLLNLKTLLIKYCLQVKENSHVQNQFWFLSCLHCSFELILLERVPILLE
jgi:hypothetical protein